MPTQHDSKHEELDYTPEAVPLRARVTGLNPNEPAQAPVQGPYPDNVMRKPAKLHYSTYEYLRPTEEQIFTMSLLRTAARQYSDMLEEFLPDGPDKTFILRAHRANAMWVNIAVTRNADGSPRA
jgi:hypothetical protein